MCAMLGGSAVMVLARSERWRRLPSCPKELGGGEQHHDTVWRHQCVYHARGQADEAVVVGHEGSQVDQAPWRECEVLVAARSFPKEDVAGVITTAK